jgi:hypothetical protein
MDHQAKATVKTVAFFIPSAIGIGRCVASLVSQGASKH